MEENFIKPQTPFPLLSSALWLCIHTGFPCLFVSYIYSTNILFYFTSNACLMDSISHIALYHNFNAERLQDYGTFISQSYNGTDAKF